MKSIDLKSLLLGAAITTIVFLTIAAARSTGNNITDYKVVSANNAAKCSDETASLIREEWKPLDGISVSISTHGTIYAQALVKSE